MTLHNRVNSTQKFTRRIVLVALMAANFSSCASVNDAHSLRGIYYWGGEVESFYPCGSDQSFWVVGTESTLQALRTESMRLSKERGEAFQPVYVEAVAISEKNEEDGFAADYDGVYKFTLIKSYGPSIPLDCQAQPRKTD